MLDTLLVSTWQYLECFLYLLLPAGCLSVVVVRHSVDGAFGQVGDVVRTVLVVHNSKQEVANA